MNSHEIDRLLRKNAVTAPSYLGVFPSDKLEGLFLEPDQKIVINFCPSSTAGCHWICVARSSIKNRKEIIEYFDSSGLPSHTYNHNIFNFIKKHKLKVIYNKIPIQDETSATCGQFCLVYLFFKSLNYSMKQIINFYSRKSLHKNNFIVKRLFKKFFK